MPPLLTTIKEKITTYIGYILFVLFISVIALSQYAYDQSAPPYSTKIKTVERDLLPEKMLSYSHFGFSTFLADVYWIRVIQDFVAWDGEDLFFLNYFKNISALDPRFEHPYLFAIWTIPVEKKTVERLDRVAEVVKRGMEKIPTSWQIPYALGTQYFLATKTYEKAKEYLKIAAENKNAPPGVFLNYSSFVINEVKGFRASYDLVKVIYDTTTDETLKKILAIGLEKEVINTMLERGILAYKTTEGVYPSDLKQLIEKNYVSLPTAFLEKFSVALNLRTGSFKIEEKK